MEQTFSFRYTESDVVSAQRLRFRHNARLWVVGAAIVAGAVYLAVAPGKAGPYGWLFILGVGVIIYLAAYLLAPHLDFRLNADWRATYAMHVEDLGLTVGARGPREVVRLPWRGLKRRLENREVYVLYWGGEQDFVILPKRVIPNSKLQIPSAN